jgi:palmitoyltransferase
VAATKAADALALKRLLGGGASACVPSNDAKKSTALHWAAFLDRDGSHLDCIEALLCSSDADVNALNSEGETAAMMAAAKGNLDAVQLLVAGGADLHIVTPAGFTVVHYAAQASWTLLLDYFQRRHVSLEARDAHGRTALHWAAYNGHAIMAEWLLERGADKLLPDDEACIPLHWAALQGHFGVIVVLLKHGDATAQLAARDSTGMNAEELCAEKATRVDASKKRRYLNLARRLAADAREIRLTGPLSGSRKVDWSCMGGVGSWGFTLLALVEWSVSYYIFFAWMWEDVAHREWVVLVFFLSSVWQVASWANTTFRDPGFVVDGDARKLLPRHPQAWRVLREQYESALECSAATHLPVDVTDALVRPLRSKHCRGTGRTVLRFDHFCPWMNNCIGANNYFWFVSFLCATVPISACWMTLGHSYLLYLSNGVGSTFQISSAHPALAVWFFHYGVYLLYAVLLAGQHGTLIGKNLTTNEMINGWRYGYLKDGVGGRCNPFDKGTLQNFLEFLGGGEGVVLPAKRILPDDGTVTVGNDSVV